MALPWRWVPLYLVGEFCLLLSLGAFGRSINIAASIVLVETLAGYWYWLCRQGHAYKRPSALYLPAPRWLVLLCCRSEKQLLVHMVLLQMGFLGAAIIIPIEGFVNPTGFNVITTLSVMAGSAGVAGIAWSIFGLTSALQSRSRR